MNFKSKVSGLVVGQLIAIMAFTIVVSVLLTSFFRKQANRMLMSMEDKSISSAGNVATSTTSPSIGVESVEAFQTVTTYNGPDGQLNTLVRRK